MSRTLLLICCILFFKAEAQNASAFPLDEINRERMADSLSALGDHSKAITLYENLANTEFKIARSYEALGNNTKALQFYERAITNTPQTTLPSYAYAKLLLKSGNYNTSRDVFETLSEENPDNPAFIYHLGLVREKQNDSLAIDLFQKAYTIDASHQNSCYKIAKYYTEKRKFEEAKGYIQQGLENNPNSIRFLTLEALRAFYTKEYHGALTVYQKLEELHQSNPQLHENMGISYSNTYQYEEAIKQFTVLINEYDDQNPKWHYLIGSAFMQLNYNEKARRHFELSIAFQRLPLDDEYMALSAVFRKEKNYKEEMRVLSLALHENSENEAIVYFLAIAADNRFDEKEKVIPFYEDYLKRYSENGRFREIAKHRLKDIKTELHFSKD